MRVLEFGGKYRRSKRSMRKRLQRRNSRGQFMRMADADIPESKPFYVQARPYMNPALIKVAPTLPDHWANSVKDS